MKNILQLYRDNAQREKRPVNVVKNESVSAIYIYDVIDSYWGVSAKDVISALANVGADEEVHFHINSPGGDVFEGRAIMAAIRAHNGKTVAFVDSLAASAATSIAIACDEVVISQGAFFMIHNASGMVWGDKADMREVADLLEKSEGSIIADYTGKTGKYDQQVIEWMDTET